MSRIIKFNSHTRDEITLEYNCAGPRFINTNLIMEMRRLRSGYTQVIYRSGKQIKEIFTEELPEDLMKRINARED